MLGKFVWALTALSAINVGLSPLGYGLQSLAFVQSLPAWVIPGLAYLVGLAGLLSLVMMVQAWNNCECSDGNCSSCGANSKPCGCKGPCDCAKRKNSGSGCRCGSGGHCKCAEGQCNCPDCKCGGKNCKRAAR